MPSRITSTLDFSLAYRFVELTQRCIDDPDALENCDCKYGYLARDSGSFFNTIKKPCKTTLLHNFIEKVNYSNIPWETSHLDANDLINDYYDPILSTGQAIPPWFNEDEIHNHSSELDQILKPVCKAAAESAFYILFGDRSFLFRFQKYVQQYVENLTPKKTKIMKKVGVIKRTNYIPNWLKQAIYFRDKGHCQICYKDITGLLTPINKRHFDHMLPLEKSGTNDPTNFQLLCETCNTSKGSKPLVSKPQYINYF
jgi:hypothetical protein